MNEYGVFKYPDYTLPLAVKMVAVADKFKLDVLHVHYAVPHATAALLSTQIARERPAVLLCFDVLTLAGHDMTMAPVPCGETGLAANVAPEHAGSSLNATYALALPSGSVWK